MVSSSSSSRAQRPRRLRLHEADPRAATASRPRPPPAPSAPRQQQQPGPPRLLGHLLPVPESGWWGAVHAAKGQQQQQEEEAPNEFSLSLSSSGPTRNLGERQRRWSENAPITRPVFAPGEGLQRRQTFPGDILCHHSEAPGSAGAPAVAGTSSTQTISRSGRRSRDGSEGRWPQSAEKEGLVVEPVPRGPSPSPSGPRGGECLLQLVASAGRRAVTSA